jgi:hypothetical protein
MAFWRKSVQLSTILRRVSGYLFFRALPGLLGAFFPHGFAFEIDHIGIVDEPIHDGIG